MDRQADTRGERLRKSSYTMTGKGTYRVVISLLLAVLAASSPATSAEAATEAAIARVHAVDPLIHAVIALDPTALDQARAIDRGRKARYPPAAVREDQLRYLQAKSTGERFRLRLAQWQPDHRTN
jgi:hypothetical protein